MKSKALRENMSRIAFLVLAVVGVASATELFQGQFTVKLDHFRPQDSRFVNFTYEANFEHYVAGAPFYIYIKDLFDESSQWIEHGLMVDIARNTSAALFTYSQRYFGPNRPTPTKSFEDLQFMTPEQSMQDIASFIQQIRFEHNSNAKVIVWGSGYGATIATWALKKFPHLIEGAWSSSGIYDMRVSTLGLYDTLAYTIHRDGGLKCRDTIQAAFDELDRLIVEGDAEVLQERLRLCHLPKTDDLADVGALFDAYLRYIVDYIELNHYVGVQEMCTGMQLPAGEPLTALVRWYRYAYGFDAEQCDDLSYDTFVRVATNETWESESKLRQLVYLQCTQSGLFQITDHITWLPNRIPIEYHYQKCGDILGEQYNSAMLVQANSAIANSFGAQVQRVSNVIYTNGLIDPWFTHGIAYVTDLNAVAFNIEHYARSGDLTSIRGQDPAQLNTIKHQIFNRIVVWSKWF